MEGLLWKWTNYWSGWQPRWFILDNGILSYYNSQDEVGKGCRGSIKMSVCNVLPNASDPCQLELNIAKEQHFYLKAASEKERQLWLVALGSCKAMLQTLSDPTNYISEKDHKLLHSGVKQKKSELRIYCDLLMQQVQAIKEAGASEPVNAEKVEQCAVLLSETCDTFIHTLEDCMKLVDRPSRLRHSSSREVTKPSSPVSPGMKRITLTHSPTEERVPRSILKTTHRSTSQSSVNAETEVDSPSSSLMSALHTTENDPADVHHTSNGITRELPNNAEPLLPASSSESAADLITAEESVSSQHTSEPLTPPIIGNFFNAMGSSFNCMVDHLGEGVVTRDFIACSAELAKLFDKLNSAAFSPVKNDLLGNVKKIEQKWTSDPKTFSTLQKLVSYEIEHSQHLDPNSATQALLWLTRGLLFVAHIVGEYPQHDTLYTAVSLAYERTLKPFHNIVVKGVVSIGLRAMPYKEAFITMLADDPHTDTTTDAFRNSLIADGNRYNEAVKRVCSVISDFYMKHNMVVVQDAV
ncbi:pleckstrin homology domain-containing family A member 3-like [Watersipora subatra]|uniref:pleckstrin homology domain-containing family A member 3-like n=1 Tax=Watersipora subatra TaxID=2589382 RepID=UPI00355B8801